MAEQSAIQWTDATFNPWRGCARVSPGCEHCYAETLSKRNPAVLGTWGVDGERVIASEHYWKQPERWNAKAEQEGRRIKVFCASLADWLEDRRDLDASRHRLFDLIERTPALDWLLLTKRPENFCKLSRGSWVVSGCPANVWLGVTAENQAYWDRRVPILQTLPARIRFVSAEPLLGPILVPEFEGIHQVIIGGESGGGARVCDIGWVGDLLTQCRAAGVAGFVKQLGARASDGFYSDEDTESTPALLMLTNKKGGDIAEFPESLRVREFPGSVKETPHA